MGECCLSEFDFEIEATQLSEIGKSKLIVNPTDFRQVESLVQAPFDVF